MSQPAISGTLTNVGDTSQSFRLYNQGQATVVLAAFTGTIVVEEFYGTHVLSTLATIVGSGSPITVTVTNNLNKDAIIRLRYTAKTSGAPTYTLSLMQGNVPITQINGPDGTVLFQVTDSGVTKVVRAVQTLFKYTAAKVGATAGWVVNAAADIGKLATIPASQTNSTLVIPIDDLEPGDVIMGFGLEGSIQSAGNTGTITFQLRKLARQGAGGAAVDSQVATLASPLSVTANTALIRSNAFVTLATPYTVLEGESYYLLVTATTGVSVTEEVIGALLDYLDQ